ncbi:hypothetical protein KWF25_18755 [Acinetobacter pittii]|uniref:hypothetical protein n=1 Tax=Acinetobacter pittii TaxID=48296 RepID=UPI00355B445A
MFLKNKENIENKFWLAVCLLMILVIVISAISRPFTDDIQSFIKDVSSTAATILTAYVAVILFQDWRDIKKTEILSQHSTEVFPILNDLASSLFFLKNSLGCTIGQFYKLKEYESENGTSEEFRAKISDMITHTNISDFVESSEKIKDKLFFISQSVDTNMQKKIDDFKSILDEFVWLPEENRDLFLDLSRITNQKDRIENLYIQLIVLAKEIFADKLVRYSTFNDIN